MKIQVSPQAVRLKNRQGAMLIMVAISMVILLGLVAIATDLGSGNRFRRVAQNAADAGAMAGGREIERGDVVYANIQSYALRAVTKNGFATTEAIVYSPPNSGPFKDSVNFVEVIIGKKTPTFFGWVFGKDSLQVQARAVAGLKGDATNCIYNTATVPTVGIDWVGKIEAGCGIASNGSIYLKKGLDGGGTLTAAGTIDAGRTPSSPGAPPVPDPLANLITVPAETSCDFTGYSTSVNATINPGVYCGGITVADNVLVTMTAGTYIIRGGGIRGGQIDGTAGVTIINTNGMGNNQATYGTFRFANNCQFHVFAPSSGTYKGIALIIPSNAPVSATETDYVNEFCGKGNASAACNSADPDVRGVMYLPGQAINLGNSNGKLTISGALVSKFMTSTNGGGTGCFFSDTSGNSALKRLSLVE